MMLGSLDAVLVLVSLGVGIFGAWQAQPQRR